MGKAVQWEFKNPDKVTNKPLPPPQKDEYREVAWGIRKFGDPITKLEIARQVVGANDVKIEVDYCGVCHSDLSCGSNEFPDFWSMYPCIPGHELAGRVVEVGKNVVELKVGDKAGIGTYVDSCMECPMCKVGSENYCFKMMVETYNGTKRLGHVGGNPDTHTYGGYSRTYVCHQRFVFKLPDGIALEKAAPLLCAGITMFEPLVAHGAHGAAKLRIGIAGIGGLGTMGIKLASKMGNTVTAISSSNRKKDLALQKGADNFVAVSDEEAMMKNLLSLDLILDTVPVEHDIKSYLSLLAPGGSLVLIGMASSQEVAFFDILPPKKITSSAIGGVKNTKDMIKFCYENDVFPDIEVITADKLNDIWAKLQKEGNASSIRYVLDINASCNAKEACSLKNCLRKI